MDVFADYITYIATAAAIAMAVTNLVKMGGTVPNWTKPLISYFAALIGLVLFLYFKDGTLSSQLAAGCTVFAAIATGGAVALHELDKGARNAENERAADEYLSSRGGVR